MVEVEVTISRGYRYASSKPLADNKRDIRHGGGNGFTQRRKAEDHQGDDNRHAKDHILIAQIGDRIKRVDRSSTYMILMMRICESPDNRTEDTKDSKRSHASIDSS